MHTNSTPNYNLPQYVGSDIINPLTDTNGAYSAIDSAIKEVADGVVSDGNRLTALEETVGDNTSGLVKKVADLENQNGDSVLTTTAQTLSGAINELDDHVDTVTGVAATNASNITDLQSNKADKSSITDGYVLKSESQVSVTTDGVKTYAEVLAELMTAMQTAVSGIAANQFIRARYIAIGGLKTMSIDESPITLYNNSTVYLEFTSVNPRADGHISFYKFAGGTSSVEIITGDVASDSITSASIKNIVPATGRTFTVHYDIYQKVMA